MVQAILRNSHGLLLDAAAHASRNRVMRESSGKPSTMPTGGQLLCLN